MNCVRATLFLLTIFICFGHFSVSAFEFQVGGTKDWVVPPTNDSKIYNDWASGNRFLVGDTIRFKYKKDSVMEVTEEDGASGHCQRGQRMIVKVMSLEESPSRDRRSSGSRAAVFSVFVQFVVSYVACLLF
ncbi:PREDICTED: early nodulin [Prunus dulcis]|uniref:PREDICTED: early nodulin n=1 Tax=Prunus dulcis TaxID=3755 RepID=A0A5E4ETL9_PRUDU|nr:PREDICTED: early nodulin [Prunus dulcis]